MTLAATIRGLPIEDNPGDARLIQEMLRDAHGVVELAHADRLALGLEQLTKQLTDVVLLDLTLPDSQGFETLTRLHAEAPDVAVRGSGSAGSGLRLAIARALVESHGGRVWAESAPGAGSTFHVCVPGAEPSVPWRPLQGNTEVPPTPTGSPPG